MTHHTPAALTQISLPPHNTTRRGNRVAQVATPTSLSAAAPATGESPVDQLLGFFSGQGGAGAGAGKKEYTVVVTGATGMIGKALTKALQAGTVGGKPVKVVPISRSGGATSWDPASGAINANALEGADAVVHLAGECGESWLVGWVEWSG